MSMMTEFSILCELTLLNTKLTLNYRQKTPGCSVNRPVGRLNLAPPTKSSSIGDTDLLESWKPAIKMEMPANNSEYKANSLYCQQHNLILYCLDLVSEYPFQHPLFLVSFSRQRRADTVKIISQKTAHMSMTLCQRKPRL